MTEAENQERQKARISLTMKPVRGETTIVQQTLDICLICCTKPSVVCTNFRKTSACFLTILGKNLHHLFLVWNKQG